MSNAVLLIDVENCNFMIERKNNEWQLPTLSDIKNIEEIPDKFKEKYNLDINNLTLIKRNDKDLFIKCNLQDKKYDKSKFNVEVLNGIVALIKNKKQKELVSDIVVKIGFEMINDSFWLGIILSTEDKLKDTTLKFIISDFLVFFSSIFCEESIKYKFGGIKEDFNATEKEIKEIRNLYLKDCPSFESKTSKKIIDEMGINYDTTVYDSVLFFANNNLIDINSRTWKNREKEKHDLFGGIVLSPRKWIKNSYPQFSPFFEDIRETYVNYFIKRFDSINMSYKSYSTHRLFQKSNITSNEKTYILQRLGLLKTIIMISNTFGNGNFISNSEDNKFKISFDNYLLKVKATIIEMIWNDYKQNKEKLPILSKIVDNYPKDICSDFFKINRKCRDNIHYGFYNDISEEEIAILNQYQEKYINYVIGCLEKEIIYKFNISYKMGLSLAKLQYLSSH